MIVALPSIDNQHPGASFVWKLFYVKSLALLAARPVDTDSSGDSNNIVDLTHMTDDELETTMNRLDISDTANVSIVNRYRQSDNRLQNVNGWHSGTLKHDHTSMITQRFRDDAELGCYRCNVKVLLAPHS